MSPGWRGFLFLVMLVFAGCAEQPSRALKVATVQWLGFEPFYLAQYMGAYDTRIDVVQLPSTPDVMRAFRNGNVDVAAITLNEALLMASQGEDLVLLAALDFSRGADVVLAWPPMARLKDIRGEVVGVDVSGKGVVLLMAGLEQAGLAASDVIIKNMTVDQQEADFLAHEVVAVVTNEPLRTRLRKQGAVVLFDSGAVPELMVDVLVARRSAVAEHDVQLRDLVRGYYLARDYMMTSAADADTFIAKRLKMTQGELELALNGLYLPSLSDNIRWLTGTPSPFESARQYLYSLMLAQQLIDPVDHLSVEADARWLMQVQQ